ncbi:hypothetical protein J6590_078353 [Homalodisca vitripennis]|nr:hypothetical protein J6590_078353 [Homalodisca vitripennis]
MSARAASLYSAAAPQECRATKLNWDHHCRSDDPLRLLGACLEHLSVVTLWTVWFARCGTALMSAILHNIVALSNGPSTSGTRNNQQVDEVREALRSAPILNCPKSQNTTLEADFIHRRRIITA